MFNMVRHDNCVVYIHTYQERICIVEVHGSGARGDPQGVFAESSKYLSSHSIDTSYSQTQI
jgi:hypothetical protein